jgi:hypothetical protein
MSWKLGGRKEVRRTRFQGRFTGRADFKAPGLARGQGQASGSRGAGEHPQLHAFNYQGNISKLIPKILFFSKMVIIAKSN